MGVTEIFIVWFISSWMVFFGVASIGVTSQADAGDVSEGTEPSAPVNPQMGKKVIWACAGGVIFTLLFWLGMVTGLFANLFGLIDYTAI